MSVLSHFRKATLNHNSYRQFFTMHELGSAGITDDGYCCFSRLTPALPFTGKLALNNKLSHAKPLLKDSILGPESIAIRGDELYTGIIGGNVVRYKNGKMDVVTKFGKDCGMLINIYIYIYIFWGL